LPESRLGWRAWKQRAERILAWPQKTFWSSATVSRCAVRLALWRRAYLRGTLVVGVTGSAGKSTTRHVIHALLEDHLGPGVSTPAATRYAMSTAMAVLQVRRSHRFLAAEMHEGVPGCMRPAAQILQPDVAIITVARDDHASAFSTPEGLFEEMEELVRHLSTSGTAILNADDPVVLGMRRSCRGHVLSYGLNPEADVRAEDVAAAWPEHLRLTLVHGDAREPVQTRMLSEHWLPTLLAATACGRVAGMSLQQIARVLSQVEPYEGRMQETRSHDGVTFIRDDFKAPQWTVPACLEFLRRAKTPRKLLVLGEVSDVDDSKSAVLGQLAIDALAVADLVVVVGPWSSAVLGLKRGAEADRVFAFTHTRDASEFVNRWARPGDLVLLKGSNRQNHLARIALDREGSIRCWRDNCQLDKFCSACDQRMQVVGPQFIVPTLLARDRAAQSEPVEFMVLGLGNAQDSRYDNTPHNIGFAFLDALAASHSVAWKDTPWGWRAAVTLGGRRLWLVKMRSSMNQIGPKLPSLLASLRLSPQRCILAFDDVAMPLGKIRLRLRGSAGGHRGVASILEAAQSDAFPRLKLGVAPSDAQVRIADYVLRPFQPDTAPLRQAMLAQGEGRLRELLEDVLRRDQGAAASSRTGVAESPAAPSTH
jgi:UDP-N-acetylmuramoyl-tripeptide--D-alanyl-D-alanine ligase